MLTPLTSPVTNVPPQMIPYYKKIKNKKKWAKESVDAFEALGRRQTMENLRFSENYQMVNGKFIWSHYFDEEGYTDMLTMLTREFEIPSTLRHYDIIGKIINNLVERLSQFPDIFRVTEIFEDDDTNEYVRTQTRLMHESIKASINKEIQNNLIANGIDPNKQDFTSEEEAMAYYQEVQQMAQAMTPAQIDKYMKTDWKSQGEIWGNHQLMVDKERFRLHELERVEFYDMLLTARCYRHFFITGDGYSQETWNPMQVFHHTLEWVQDGDYVGRMWFDTKSGVIERYAWKMQDKDFEKLEDLDEKWGGKHDLSGFPYNVYAPFPDYKAYHHLVKNTGYDPLNKVGVMNDQTLAELTTRMPYLDRGTGLYRITEVYWKSQRKIGKAVYIDEDTGFPAKDLVDENFVLPEGWKEKKGDFYNGNELNTVYWTYVNEVWKGTKIACSLSDEDAIYLDLDVVDFQFKGDYSPFGAKLPVCGRITNCRNAQAMSLVDYAKPHQVGHNLAMNQLYQIMEKEIGAFVVWDASFFNTMKDWGGEDSWDKIALVARELGHVFGDTSPTNTKGANPGNQLPKVIDLDATARMLNRAKLADFFEQKFMAQLGISPQMMSDISASETLGGIQTAVSQSQLNVQRYYSDFFEYKQRCLTMNLDVAQYVQSKNKDITIQYTKSDASREFVKMNGTDLLLRNMHVYVVNSQELMRQMELLRNLFINNNTTAASALDLAEILTAYSPAEIKIKLKEAEDKKEMREKQMMEQQQSAIQQQGQIATQKEDREDARNTEDNQTLITVAEIQAGSKPQQFKEPVPDNRPLETAKLGLQAQSNSDKARATNDANDLKRTKQQQDTILKNRELDLKEKKVKADIKKSENEVRIAKTNKN